MKLARVPTVAQHIGQPLGVLDSGRAARDRLDMVGVDHQHLALSLQQVKHWPPGGPGRLHDHGTAALCPQPIGQREHIGGHGVVGMVL
jgi:hypothetical protein